MGGFFEIEGRKLISGRPERPIAPQPKPAIIISHTRLIFNYFESNQIFLFRFKITKNI